MKKPILISSIAMMSSVLFASASFAKPTPEIGNGETENRSGYNWLVPCSVTTKGLFSFQVNGQLEVNDPNRFRVSIPTMIAPTSLRIYLGNRSDGEFLELQILGSQAVSGGTLITSTSIPMDQLERVNYPIAVARVGTEIFCGALSGGSGGVHVSNPGSGEILSVQGEDGSNFQNESSDGSAGCGTVRSVSLPSTFGMWEALLFMLVIAYIGMKQRRHKFQNIG